MPYVKKIKPARVFEWPCVACGFKSEDANMFQSRSVREIVMCTPCYNAAWGRSHVQQRTITARERKVKTRELIQQSSEEAKNVYKAQTAKIKLDFINARKQLKKNFIDGLKTQRAAPSTTDALVVAS